MSKRKTHEEFLREVYDLVREEYIVIGEYVNARTKIVIKHNNEECGYYEFEIIPDSFLRGTRCPKCAGTIKITHEEFVNEIYNLTKDEYIVLSRYNGAHKKVKIKHRTCGYEYEVTPSAFKRGQRCPKCMLKQRSDKAKKTHEEFVKEVYDKYLDEYSLLGVYESYHKHIKVKHNKCGHVWNVKPSNLMSGKGCPKCKSKTSSEKQTWSHDEFINIVRDLVGNEYVFLEEYKGANEKILVKHNLCNNEYKVAPSKFINLGRRCPKCAKLQSKGVKRIEKWLIDNNYTFEREYSFKDCRYIQPLPFDFAVKTKDNDILCLIEYDGEQHYKPVIIFGGEKALEETKMRDNIKNEYCKKNGIKLIRIPYWEFDNIERIIKKELSYLIDKRKK